MSSLKNAIAILENEIEAADGRPDEQPRPYLVAKDAQGAGNTLTRRVGAVLDFSVQKRQHAGVVDTQSDVIAQCLAKRRSGSSLCIPLLAGCLVVGFIHI
jgi:hypothetical protein